MYIVLHIWGVNSDPIAIMKRKEKALCICKVDLKLCWILKSQFQFPLRKDMELKSINLKDLPVSLNASIVVAVKSRLEQKLDLGLFCIADIHRGFIFHCGINLYPSISLIKMNISSILHHHQYSPTSWCSLATFRFAAFSKIESSLDLNWINLQYITITCTVLSCYVEVEVYNTFHSFQTVLIIRPHKNNS